MKKFLFILMELMICSGMFAGNNWTYSFSGITSVYENSLVIGDSLTILSVKTGNECYYTRQLVALDRNGNERWSVPGEGSVLAYDSTGIFAAALDPGMFDAGPDSYYAFQKFDFSGNKLFQRNLAVFHYLSI